MHSMQGSKQVNVIANDVKGHSSNLVLQLHKAKGHESDHGQNR